VKKNTLLAVLLGFAGVFLALAWPGAGLRGIVAEEAQPHLHRYPIVLTRAEPGARPEPGARSEPNGPPSAGPAGRADGQTPQEGPRPPSIVRMPPYEEGAPARPRWVTTSQWPVIAYDGESRVWPVLLRGPETALGSYVHIAIGPILGGGIAGVRRSTVLLGLCVVLLTGLVAARLHRRANVPPGPGGRAGAADPSPGEVDAIAGAAALVAGSFGVIALARTGHISEVAGLLAMMLALAGLASREPPTVRRAAWVGLACGVAILCHAAILIAIVPAILVLCLSRDRTPSRRAAATLAALGVVLPVLLVALLALAAPFQSGNAPFGGAPLEHIPARMLVIHRQLVLTLAWLGDATSVWGPLARGEAPLGSSLWRAAAIGGVPFVAATVRLAFGRAETGEKLFLATLASSVLAGALLYEGPNAFQLALGLEPFFALALAEQIAALVGASRAPAHQAVSRRARAYRVRAWALGAVVVLLRIDSISRGLGLDAMTANPMLSGKAQRAAVLRMTELELTGPEVVTTAYHHVGVLEGWTDGAIRPLHAWPALESPPDANDCPIQASWREIFRVYRPRYVLLTEGPTLHESRGTRSPAIARGLRRAAEIAGMTVHLDSSFPTESGGPGWALVRLRYPPSLLAPGRDELAVDPACPIDSTEPPAGERLSSFEGLAPGGRVGAMRIEGLERRDGVVRITVKRNDDVAVLEVRPEGEGPPPAASGGGYGVSYRNSDTRVFQSEELVAAAAAIAAELARARPPAAPPR
jgi:hypothetical protein